MFGPRKMKQSKVKYNPKLSISENAKINGCSEANIRYYIKANQIDRNYERKAAIINQLRNSFEDGMTAYALAKKVGISITTIKKYWHCIIDEDDVPIIDSQKNKKMALKQKNEYYATHPSVTEALMKAEKFAPEILEPCCGGGFMADVIKSYGYKVEATDLIDRGYGKGNVDFLLAPFQEGRYDIITNPPYSLFLPMIKKALKMAKNKVAMLLPLHFLSSMERLKFYEEHPPVRVYVFSHRICIAKNGKFDDYEAGQNTTIYAWFVWEKDYKGETILKWIYSKKSNK